MSQTMTDLWIIFIVVLTLIEFQPTSSTQVDSDEPLLTKSVGFAIRSKFGKTLEDARLNQEYMGLYQDILKASQEKFDDKEEQRLEEVVGRERLQIMKRGVLERRRKVSGMYSAIGRRRSRSQATRREKLYSQSLRNHQQHIRHSGQEYHLD